MNILDKIPSLEDKAPERTEVVDTSGPRGRKSLGPQKFRTQTNGQLRRQRQRELDSMTRKARRQQVRTYFATVRQASTILGHLQAAGVVAYSSDYQASTAQKHASAQWIFGHFGERQVGVVDETESLKVALQKALNTWERLVDRPLTQIEWHA